ncbi:MAG: CvpA family protein [Clostridia bacterium]|nr:CvpA family protein [Clostridia bacterium]
MTMVLDIAFIVLIAAIVILAVKKGFVEALFDGLSTIIAGILAYILAEPVAKFAYDSFVRGMIKSQLTNAISDSKMGLSNNDENIATLISELPQNALRLAECFGFNVSAISDAIIKQKPADTEALVESFMVNIADNVLLTFTQSLVLVVLFILAVLLVKFIVRIFDDTISKIPVVREVNGLLGGVFGVIKSVIVLVIVCTILFFIVGQSDDEFLSSLVSTSKIYEFVNNNNPLLKIFS